MPQNQEIDSGFFELRTFDPQGRALDRIFGELDLGGRLHTGVRAGTLNLIEEVIAFAYAGERQMWTQASEEPYIRGQEISWLSVLPSDVSSQPLAKDETLGLKIFGIRPSHA